MAASATAAGTSAGSETSSQRDEPQGGQRSPVRKASRPQVIASLDRQDLLPAITFIFSRAGCDAAVAQCVAAGLWLTTEREQQIIAQRVDEAAQDIPSDDLDVLGFWSWRDGLLRGLAAHHAGMLPTFKEVVEKLFVDGLVKAVFATETLALGVNMPARCVVLEKLDKFNGEAHVNITAGEYTQLTGRAGRRGIDVEGHAVVLWQPGTDPAAVAGLASRRTYPLNSSFRPTYNMSINLLAQFGRPRAREILESSFAQFQADRSVVGLARQVRSREESLAGFSKAMTCHLGDFTEYARLRRALADAEKTASKSSSRARKSLTEDSLSRLLPGDVVDVPAGKSPGLAVVLSSDHESREPRPAVMTLDNQLRRIGLHDVEGPLSPITRIRIPEVLQRQGPQVPPRLGVLGAQRHPRAPAAGAAAPRRRLRPGRGRAQPGEADRRAAPGAPRPPVPRLQRTRGPRPLVRTLVEAPPGNGRADPPDPGPDQHHRQDVRPRVRRPDELRLPGNLGHRRALHQPGRAAAAADLRRKGPADFAVPADGRLQRPRRRRDRRPGQRRSSTRPSARTAACGPRCRASPWSPR